MEELLSEHRFRMVSVLDTSFIVAVHHGLETMEMCSGVVFAFRNPRIEELSDYMGLFKAFFPVRR